MICYSNMIVDVGAIAYVYLVLYFLLKGGAAARLVLELKHTTNKY